MDKENNKFFVDLIGFYSSFLKGNSKAIKKLADIQDNYPDIYKIIDDLKDNPSLIEEISEKLTSEQKDILIKFILKSSMLNRKLQNLFECSADEKRKLADELEKFGESFEQDMKKIIDKKES